MEEQFGRKRHRAKGEVVDDCAGAGVPFDEAETQFLSEAMTDLLEDNKFDRGSISSLSDTSGPTYMSPVTVVFEPTHGSSHEPPPVAKAAAGGTVKVPTHVEVSIMAQRTAVIVIAPDRSGLLERITASLSSQNLSVLEAKIKTLPHGIARDTFDVVDALTGLPVKDTDRLKVIEETLKNDLLLPDSENETKIRVNVPDRPGALRARVVGNVLCQTRPFEHLPPCFPNPGSNHPPGCLSRGGRTCRDGRTRRRRSSQRDHGVARRHGSLHRGCQDPDERRRRLGDADGARHFLHRRC
jgi:hypothetical protein